LLKKRVRRKTMEFHPSKEGKSSVRKAGQNRRGLSLNLPKTTMSPNGDILRTGRVRICGYKSLSINLFSKAKM